MKRMILAIIVICLIALASVGNLAAQIGWGSANSPAALPPSKRTADDFNLKDLDGKMVKLSDYKGKVVILDFWATWCPPCVKEIPHFNELSKTYGPKGLVVLGVSVDQGGAKDVLKFKGKNKIDYRVVIDDQKTGNAYQQFLPKEERGGIPYTFVIDKEGVIRQHFVGYRPKEVFEEVIKGLL